MHWKESDDMNLLKSAFLFSFIGNNFTDSFEIGLQQECIERGSFVGMSWKSMKGTDLLKCALRYGLIKEDFTIWSQWTQNNVKKGVIHSLSKLRNCNRNSGCSSVIYLTGPIFFSREGKSSLQDAVSVF